jgi:hypothetical protein
MDNVVGDAFAGEAARRKFKQAATTRPLPGEQHAPIPTYTQEAFVHALQAMGVRAVLLAFDSAQLAIAAGIFRINFCCHIAALVKPQVRFCAGIKQSERRRQWSRRSPRTFNFQEPSLKCGFAISLFETCALAAGIEGFPAGRYGRRRCLESTL